MQDLPAAPAIQCRTQHEWLPDAGAPAQLILLLHGWASDGAAMAPLALALRAQFPQAAILAPDAPQRAASHSEPNRDVDSEGNSSRDSDNASARRLQWYSIRGLTAQDWPARVAGAVPALQAWVHAQQQRLGVRPAATALGGFSQGAILSLALALHEDGIAGRVLAFGGCFTAPPLAAPRHTTVHLFHGGADRTIPVEGSRNALQWLSELQGDATLDIAEGLGHTLHPVLIDCALQRLQTHIPLRTWQAALGAVPAARDPACGLDD